MRARTGIGREISMHRVVRGWSQHDLGVAAGLSQQKIQRIEVGQKQPTRYELTRIMEALAVNERSEAGSPLSGPFTALEPFTGPAMRSATDDPSSQLAEGEGLESSRRQRQAM